MLAYRNAKEIGLNAEYNKIKQPTLEAVNRSFVPSATGQYRYRIENVGTSQVRNWRMEGRMPLFTIPGT